jgi:uncharacterized membrane protein YeaQ/YmgE (transglycosylase-associated protein family)
MFIIVMIIVGLVAGAVARLLMPGDDNMGIFATLILGLVGSLVGGFLGWLIFGRDAADGAFQVSGFIGSIIGALIALAIYRASQGRSVGRGTHASHL